MRSHPIARVQRGATLIMGVIFMTILMMVVTIAFRMSNTNLQAVGNMQAQTEADAAAQAAIERVISTDAIFLAPVATTVPADAYGVSVNVAVPVCKRSIPVQANTSPDSTPNIYQQGVVNAANSGFVETYWDLQADATSQGTGAKTEIHQGIRVVLPSDPNPCPLPP